MRKELKDVLERMQNTLDTLRAENEASREVAVADADDTLDEDGPTLIITGNPVDGLRYIGPLPSQHDAIAYADRAGIDQWWLAPVAAPDEAILAQIDEEGFHFTEDAA